MKYTHRLNQVKDKFYKDLTPSLVLKMVAAAAKAAYEAGYHQRQEEIDKTIPRHQMVPVETNAIIYSKDQGYEE